jgi:hypothetical protein
VIEVAIENEEDRGGRRRDEKVCVWERQRERQRKIGKNDRHNHESLGHE